MKLNKLFMVLAATAIVGCTSDELNDFSANQAPEQDSRLIELDENFAIAGVGVEESATRTHWEQDDVTKALKNKFLPIYAKDAVDGKYLYKVDETDNDEYADLYAQAVGLCWLGQVPGTDVYTNYQFYHFGWLNKGVDKAIIECDELTNGSLYSDIKLKAHATAKKDKEADPANHFTVPDKSKKDGADNLNYNSGVYKTDNKAIFGGDYIVYYPFNEDFKDAGTIPAKAETVFNNVPEDFKAPEIGKATFRYSSPVEIKGGDQAAGFGLYNLSALVQLRVAGPKDVDIAKNIDQIVLWSKKEQLLKQANLAADKIVAGKKGAELYAETEGTQTIVANFAAAVAVNATNLNPTSAYITVLPTTVEDLVVKVHSTDGKWATVDLGNTEFKAGSAKVLNIPVTAADFKDEFIAVDQTSLETALANAHALALSATNPATITVIGDITLTADLAITDAKDAFITIEGDDIIVPEDVTLTVKTNMASDVRVLGKSCCDGAQGGRLTVAGGTINNVTMEPTEAKVADDADYLLKNPLVEYTGAATVAAGKTFDVQAGTVYVNEAVEHKGAITIAEGANLIVNEDGTDKGDLQFMGSTVVNDGTIEVMKGGKFDMTDATGNATATDGQRMTNNGKFIHNVDAGVGTAVQSMHQNGEYRCRVDEQIKLDDAFLQWTACSVIEMVDGTGADVEYDLGTAESIAYKHNGKYIDIEVNNDGGNTTTFVNKLAAGKYDNKVINVGNLTVTAGELVVDYVKGAAETLGQRSLIVNGDMTVADDTDLTSSKKIDIKQNLTVKDAATLTFAGDKANVDGLAVAGDITVSGSTFDASDVDAINITCANFYLKKVGATGATATFGNRTGGGDTTMTVGGTIDNPAGCEFNISAAAGGNVLARITCKELKVGGDWDAARPLVVK